MVCLAFILGDFLFLKGAIKINELIYKKCNACFILFS